MHEINCRKCRRVMKIQVWYFKWKVLHYKNTETETSGEEKEIVAVAQRQLRVSSESWSRQVKSRLNLTLRSRLQSREEVRLSRGGRTRGLEPRAWPWLYRNRKYGLLPVSWHIRLPKRCICFPCAFVLTTPILMKELLTHVEFQRFRKRVKISVYS